MSTSHRKIAIAITTPNTISVVCTVSWRDGQTTLRTSVRESSRNRWIARPRVLCSATKIPAPVSNRKATTRRASEYPSKR